jgi:hypothetical protein
LRGCPTGVPSNCAQFAAPQRESINLQGLIGQPYCHDLKPLRGQLSLPSHT